MRLPVIFIKKSKVAVKVKQVNTNTILRIIPDMEKALSNSQCYRNKAGEQA